MSDPDEDHGLARERTALAWTRTALSFGAVGGVIVKSHVLLGLAVLGCTPVIWQLGRLTMREAAGQQQLDRRMRMILAVVIAVATAALVMSFLGRGAPVRSR